jgi:hypothetical protein
MSTNTLDTVAPSSGFAPALFKAASAITFALGCVIHIGRIIVGREEWVRQFFTPPVDIAFGGLILIAAIPGLMSWGRYAGGRAGRIGYGFAMFMLIISVPLHLKTIFTWDTTYLIVFPYWYSAIEVPMFAALSYMATQLKFR